MQGIARAHLGRVLTPIELRTLLNETGIPHLDPVKEIGPRPDLAAAAEAVLAMEMGADAVLVNTAIASASDPVRMARAFKLAVKAGRTAHEAGLGTVQETAFASSPLTGFLRETIQKDKDE